jgi:CheY-like chemotaxis protein
MAKHRIVVLDDDEDNLMILESALADSDYSVRAAHSCAEAKELIESERPDALVSDFALGDGTAVELMDELGDRRPRVAVLVSGFGSAEDREASAAAGFQAHLVKPIALDRLRTALRSMLES